MTDMPIARSRDGKESIRSTNAMTTVSTLPPKYPEHRPTANPAAIESSADGARNDPVPTRNADRKY